MVGLKIAQLRAAAGYSRRQLADRLKVDPSTVAYWERDGKMPHESSLVALAEEFDVDVGALFESPAQTPPRRPRRHAQSVAGIGTARKGKKSRS